MPITRRLALALAGCATGACHGGDAAAPDAAPGPVTITATIGSTRFVTREHLLAATEMQLAGEPLAEAMGRDLTRYSRDRLPPDLYDDPRLAVAWIDLPGFSTGIESYEYSKQPMNNLAFEAGAGTSLAYGPLLDADGATGAAATAHLIALVQRAAAQSHALGRFVFPAGTFPVGNPVGNTNPLGAGDPAHDPLGWPGLWPTLHPFRSFDPAIDPSGDVSLFCALTSDDNTGESGGISGPLVCGDYECDATTLHLRDRAAQIEPTITPGADGFSGWKYGLWVLNYLEIMHDAAEGPVAAVAESDLANVGAPDNVIAGADDAGGATVPGTYLGSSDVEGFQAQLFLAMLDERAEDWLAHLSTTDGAALTGFAGTAQALAYDHAAPLRWFPAEIAVSEDDLGGGFPRPRYAIGRADSELLDLVGLTLAYAELFALTDTRNAGVGGTQAARVYFDGDPFAADDQQPDGDPTPHDRALAMLRVALVDLDRLHGDPATGALVDRVTFAGGSAVRGHTIATTSLVYALVGLRTARRALGAQLGLYSNNTPDTAGVASPLDALPLHYPGEPALTFGGRLDRVLRAQAAMLYDHLTDASGRAYAGWDLATAAPTDDGDGLDAHAAAIRGLFAAYLATGDVRYRDRARAVFARMDAVFYDPVARIYGATPAPVTDVEYTPLRFALVQAALREVYQLIASRPGGEALEPVIESRLGRLDKLVLNGWDDRDGDRRVAWPDECVRVEDGLPRGGLQMAERTLTGEFGSTMGHLAPGMPRTATADREHDCVPEIDDAHVPAALADSITFHVSRP